MSNAKAHGSIVTSGDQNYAWGVLLLLLSIRRWEMNEPVLVGAYFWDPRWVEFIRSFSNVRVVELPRKKCCLTEFKPDLMLRSGTDYVTWVDSDGIFSGNCSDFLYGEPDRVYSRYYTPGEMANHPFARMPNTVKTWLSDVGDLPQRRDIPDICSNIIGVSLSHSGDLLRRWKSQMERVLVSGPDSFYPANSSDKKSPYFQTDEAVLNSLLSCWRDAPQVTADYRLNNPKTSHYIHFAYNPKPWQSMWTPYSLRFYDKVLDLVEWADSQKLLPDFETLPSTLRRKNKVWYRMCAPCASKIGTVKKIVRKLLAKHVKSGPGR